MSPRVRPQPDIRIWHPDRVRRPGRERTRRDARPTGARKRRFPISGCLVTTTYAHARPSAVGGVGSVSSQKAVALTDHRDIAALDLHQFPCADYVLVRWGEHMLELVDESLSLLVGFPWWDRQDVERAIQSPAGAPLGDVDEPFHDEEQGWRILIWRDAGMVGIMQGDEDAFAVWFRVPLEQYLAAWTALAATD